MRYHLVTILILFIFVGCKPITYVDYKYDVMTKEAFSEKIDNKKAFEIPAKSKRTKRLIKRTQFGVIKEKEAFYKQLNHSLNKLISLDDYLIVDYYQTNSSCLPLEIYNTKDTLYLQKNPQSNLVDDALINQIVSNYKYISILPKNTDLKESPEDFSNDLDGLFQKMFFNYDYPCHSIVMIAPDGRFISYLGTHDLKTKYDLLITLVKNKNNQDWQN
ncbi:MAG: hypothetical protein RI558_04145 [Psychroflexus sp.]|nr:hypothetical protein [Psychroflexus sp.]MDR9448399.1 hypothetical protein [Psychroflexus sp.]